MSIDLAFTGNAVGTDRVAYQWDRIEVAFGPDRVHALDDRGLEIGWDDDSLEEHHAAPSWWLARGARG